MSNDSTGKVWATAVFSNGALNRDSNRQIQVRDLSETNGAPLARVKVSCGMTINLGNYESARVDAGVELPCFVEEVPEAYKTAWSIAEREVEAQVKSIRGGGGQ